MLFVVYTLYCCTLEWWNTRAHFHPLLSSWQTKDISYLHCSTLHLMPFPWTYGGEHRVEHFAFCFFTSPHTQTQIRRGYLWRRPSPSMWWTQWWRECRQSCLQPLAVWGCPAPRHNHPFAAAAWREPPQLETQHPAQSYDAEKIVWLFI